MIRLLWMVKNMVYAEVGPNGQLESEEPYVDGRKHGICRGWRPNGQLHYETHYVDGKKT